MSHQTARIDLTGKGAARYTVKFYRQHLWQGDIRCNSNDDAKWLVNLWQGGNSMAEILESAKGMGIAI